tara:strand:- start:244808 stop:245830 length:1023 start_codon:yes stop_codon:yes gene_type:complete
MKRHVLEKFLNKIWYPERDQVGTHVVQILLWPVSLLYKLIIFCRYYLLKFHYKGKTNPIPVIVVGNITVGGTGKTPFVIYLAEFLKQNGYVPGIISRGYGGKKGVDETLAVEAQVTAQQVGDEPFLIHKNTQCPVVVGVKRNNSIAYMAKHYPDVNIIISDDGLQHYAMARDIEIILIDGQRRLGNQHCLPAGPLREPASRLRRADFIIVKNGEYHNATTMQIVMSDLVNIKTPTQKRSISDFSGQAVHAVTGIGHAMSFFQLLLDQDVRIVQHHFPDHYAFQAKDIIFPDTKSVIMTEKDAIKCTGFVGDNHWMLPIQAKLPKAFEAQLLKSVRKTSCG